jgi:general secretion pathway protein E/type IV pilus assembly protein PilB
LRELIDNSKLIKNSIINTGLLTEEQIKQALEFQQKSKDRFSYILAKMGFIANEDMVTSLPTQLGLVPSAIKDNKPTDEAIKKISSSFAYQHRILPLKLENDILTIATDDPLNFLALDNLSDILSFKIKAVLTTEEELKESQNLYYGAKKEEKKALDNVVQTIDTEDEYYGKGDEEVEFTYTSSEEDAPIIRLVSLILSEAVKNRASDIHIEPLEKEFRVRYRIDGLLHEVPAPPKHLQGSIISRIKLMAGIDIAEKRLPQDGRIRVRLLNKDLDLRVSTLPGIYGESVVMRILDKSSLLIGLEEIGFLTEDRKKFEELIEMPNGTLLVTGPTGSGKTTTLYAALNHINKPNKKLITVEDPVEYQIKGINQVQIRPQVGLTFASGLRSMLRQAPDVILVGEIRDKETASIAIQAALTGHLIFSTLHTNDAAGAVTRLIDMGVKEYLVASTLQAVLAQRLVRRICPKCKEPYSPKPEEIRAMGLKEEDLANAQFMMGKGCPECSNTGFRGRQAIFEMLIINDVIREMIFERKSSSEIKNKAIEMGMRTLKEDGKAKALKGITTISEVIRVAQMDEA